MIGEPLDTRPALVLATVTNEERRRFVAVVSTSLDVPAEGKRRFTIPVE